jgi:GrpB-like predicted nucleotidyltransferase (UPF0157 family)
MTNRNDHMAIVDESVHVAEPDSRWPQMFAAEQQRLADTLRLSRDRIEHIGSTAVPGLIAKPIIDIMVGVDRYPPEPSGVDAVSSLGYECLGEAGVPGRIYCRRRGRDNFNLHLLEFAGSMWQNNIRLREYLAACPEAKNRYSAVKLQAVQNGATRLLAYSAAKSGIVEELLREAALRSNN